MKKLFRVVLILLAIVALAAVAFYSYISIRGIPTYSGLIKDPGIRITGDSAMIANGERLGSMLCIECHLNRETNVATGAFMPDMANFGTIHSANITQDPKYGIGLWTDGQLIYFLRTGVKPDGSYAPPYMPKFVHMSDDDLYSIIAWLRSPDARLKANQVATLKPEPNFLTKFLCNVAFKPIPYPSAPILAPETSDPVAYGAYVVNAKIECWACHSADFKTLNIEEPSKSPGYLAGGNKIPDREGKIVISANLTPDPETGIGAWTEEEFVKAVKFGIRRDGTTNRYPMVPYSRMTDFEAKAAFAYLQSLPPVKNPIVRTVTN